MASRFWRIYYSGSGGYGVWIQEVKFFDYSLSQIPLGLPIGTATAGGSYSVENAFDGLVSYENNGWYVGARPCWIGMDFGSPVDVGFVICTRGYYASSGVYLPVKSETELQVSDDGVSWSPALSAEGAAPSAGGFLDNSPAHTLSFVRFAGGLAAAGNEVFGHIQGRERAKFLDFNLLKANSLNLPRDYRQVNPTGGVISDRVVLKTETGEVPFPNASVWLFRVPDGYRAWAGWSDSDGYYTATGLEVGVEYVPVAVDRARAQKATAAGPVVAVEP